MELSASALAQIDQQLVEIPEKKLLDLPERILQFGTGVLLRGLPDYFVDLANKASVFNGRIVVVKSTDTGGSDAFQQQDGLYTVLVSGYEQGKKVSRRLINSSISRVLAAGSAWDQILACASNPDMQIIISNTTEVGITLVKESIHQNPPASFPAKLLGFLWKRYESFGGSLESGMVMIPTELITDNAIKLKSILNELAVFNQMDTAFIEWMNTANDFCNSLVDRIVPGKPAPAVQQELESELGYRDALMIMAEPYSLWAIESQQERTRAILSFAQVNPGVKITGSINKFKELKLRLLNATHSFTCALAIHADFVTVKEAMRSDAFLSFVSDLMKQEIKPLILSDEISDAEATEFANQVIDRFRNDSIDHKWISISMQYSSKMVSRCLPLLRKNFETKSAAPRHMLYGFAAFLLFMKLQQNDAGHYETMINGNNYPVTDEKAALFHQHAQLSSVEAYVDAAMKDSNIWGSDLQEIPGFASQIQACVKELLSSGASNILANFAA